MFELILMLAAIVFLGLFFQVAFHAVPLIAALFSVLLDRLGDGAWILLVAAIILWLAYRVIRAAHVHIRRRRAGSDTGRSRVIDKLTDADITGPAQRITHDRVLGDDLVATAKLFGIMAEQHFRHLDRDFFVDDVGRLFTSDDERTRQ
jgi:hypothetical protein